MYQRIPNRLRPGIALVFFFCVASFLILISGYEIRPESFFVQLSFWLAVLIVPYTIYSGVVLFFNIGNVRGEWRRLGYTGIVIRGGLALGIAFSVMVHSLHHFPEQRGYLGGRSLRKNAIDFKRFELMLVDAKEDFVTSWWTDQLPEKEVEVRNLPKEIFQSISGFSGKDGDDVWGRPYMFVSEKRENELWMGVYSKGQDGISLSKGNDPDDLNTWGKDGSSFYSTQKGSDYWVKNLGVLIVGLLFFLPIFFLTFRRPYFPEDYMA